MQEIIEGFVLRERDYLESSKIIDIFTKKHGGTQKQNRDRI